MNNYIKTLPSCLFNYLLTWLPLNVHMHLTMCTKYTYNRWGKHIAELMKFKINKSVNNILIKKSLRKKIRYNYKFYRVPTDHINDYNKLIRYLMQNNKINIRVAFAYCCEYNNIILWEIISKDKIYNYPEDIKIASRYNSKYFLNIFENNNNNNISLICGYIAGNNLATVKSLIKNHTDVHNKYIKYACMSNSPKMFKYILGFGRKYNIEKFGYAIEKAAQFNSVDIIKYIISKYDNLSNSLMAFQIACMHGNEEAVNLLFRYKYLDGGLEWACEGGQYNMTKLLLSMGAKNYYYGFAKACVGNNMDCIKLMGTYNEYIQFRFNDVIELLVSNSRKIKLNFIKYAMEFDGNILIEFKKYTNRMDKAARRYVMQFK